MPVDGNGTPVDGNGTSVVGSAVVNVGPALVSVWGDGASVAVVVLGLYTQVSPVKPGLHWHW